MEWSEEDTQEFAAFVKAHPPATEDDKETMEKFTMNWGQYLAYSFGKMKMDAYVEDIKIKVLKLSGGMAKKIAESLSEGVFINNAIIGFHVNDLATKAGVDEELRRALQVNGSTLLLQDRNMIELINPADSHPERRKVRTETPVKIPDADMAKEVHLAVVKFVQNIVLFETSAQIDKYRYF